MNKQQAAQNKEPAFFVLTLNGRDFLIWGATTLKAAKESILSKYMPEELSEPLPAMIFDRDKNVVAVYYEFKKAFVRPVRPMKRRSEFKFS